MQIWTWQNDEFMLKKTRQERQDKTRRVLYHFRVVQLIRIAIEEELFGDRLGFHESPLGEVDEQAAIFTGKEVNQVVVEVIIEYAMSHQTSAWNGASKARRIHVAGLPITAEAAKSQSNC